MIRKYKTHKLQTNPLHREEEPNNNQETPGRQTQQSNQLSLPHKDNYKNRIDIKYCTTKHRTIKVSHNGVTINKEPTTTMNSIKSVLLMKRCVFAPIRLISTVIYTRGKKLRSTTANARIIFRLNISYIQQMLYQTF